MHPGVQPNGLFWTTQLRRADFHAKGNKAKLKVKDLPLVESFEFFGPNQVPGTASIDLTWTSTSGRHRRGKGTEVSPEDPAAFIGHFADAKCEGHISADRMGFAFETGPLDATGYYASMGHERNGAWLA